MNRTYRAAVFCGATPLVTGVSIFILWIITRWEWLILAGLLTLFGGPIVFVFGILALAQYYQSAMRSTELNKRDVSLATLGCLGLLLSNFLVAAGIMIAVEAIQTCYIVAVENQSRQSLTEVHVSGGGCDADLGTILPGETSRGSFWIRHDDELTFHANSGQLALSEKIDGYVTHGVGGHTIVTIQPSQTITVTKGAR